MTNETINWSKMPIGSAIRFRAICSFMFATPMRQSALPRPQPTSSGPGLRFTKPRTVHFSRFPTSSLSASSLAKSEKLIDMQKVCSPSNRKRTHQTLRKLTNAARSRNVSVGHRWTCHNKYLLYAYAAYAPCQLST
jgi:hypothetical protein